FQEFNLFSQSDEQWLDVFDRIEADYGIERTLILAIDGPRVSHYFLKYSEAFTGIHTQHIMAPTILNADTRTQHNICHKINVKMGGLNLIVKFGPIVLNLDLNSNKVIVISIDVCHATGADYKGETTEPSTIGISINNGKHPQEIYDSFFYGETREEIVEQNSLARYIEIQLKEALKYRNEIEKIIVIRDGVDEGRFSKVVEEEVKAIKSATKNLGINAAKFVVFLVNKKTNARHFKNDESSITSMTPRSFVSFGTRYKFKQFFMTPHRSITGTAVSPLVTILLDEIGITKAEAQEFLLGLTYLHQIVNSPISIPAPMNQADETSFRGQYLYRHVTRNGDETRSNDELTRLLNFGGTLAPRTRYNA
uniref:Piwi domain-containing protein n=1 Tax=Panagrolaimus sp. ES5 TaxID=591445 RepID=A0AC34FXS4_9BILA